MQEAGRPEAEDFVPGEAPPTLGLSPAAAAAADWLRDLSRTAKTVRLYRSTNPVVEEAREQFARTTSEAINRFGGWTLRITPEEIFLGDEMIVHPPRRGPERGEAAQRLIVELPFRFYRDGVREIGILPGIPRRDIDAIVEALAVAWTDRDRADDLVTSLWQANPTHLRVEAAPPEQPLYIATGSGAPDTVERSLGLGLGLPPLATDIRAELGDRGGAVGLQRESGLEDAPPAVFMSAIRAYESMRSEARTAQDRLMRQWQAESALDWHDEIHDIFNRVRSGSPEPETSGVLCRFVVTGVARAIDHGGWAEANRLLQELQALDPTGELSGDLVREAILDRSDLELGETLDGAASGELETFFSMLLGLGGGGVPLALAALRGARHGRTRAAACAALAFLCVDSPGQLEPVLQGESPEILPYIVSVLGHIGGREAATLCALVARDPNTDVSREVARATPAFPEPERTALLLELLESPDDQTALIALRSARRERNPRIAEAIMAHIARSGFDDRPEELRRTMFQALVDVGDSAIVPALEAELTHGGWFARPSWRRTTAGQTLARMAGVEAAGAIERGRAHRSEAIRAASGDPSARKSA